MSTSLSDPWPHYWRQIQLVTANISEGVILIDVDQTIRWANPAALAMHGIETREALGATIDEYHAKFQVKFRTSQSPAMQQPIDSVASGQTFRDVDIEVTPLNGDKPKWLQRVRNLVLVDEAGTPICIVLVLRALDDFSRSRTHVNASIDAMADPALIVRVADEAIVETNAAFLAATGLRRPDLVAQTLADVTAIEWPDDTARLPMADAPPLTLASLHQAGHQPGTRAGAKPVLLCRQFVEFEGQPCMLLSFADTGHLRIAEARLSQSDDAARAHAAGLCAASPVPLHVLDADMRVVAVSQSWLEWLGYARERVIGRKISEFMAASASAHFVEHTWNVLSAGGHVRDVASQFVRKSGELVEALVSAHATVHGGESALCVVGAPVDISERKRSEDRFARLFARAPVPMLVRRLEDSRILDANEAFISAMGYTAGAIMGQSIEELGLFENRAQRQQFEQDLRAGGQVENVDVRIRSAAGESLDCLLSAEPVHIFGQKCTLMILQDVTDRRRNEAQLFQAIEMVMSDTTWFSRGVIEKLATLRAPPRPGAVSAEIGDLTPREREVLGLISHGMTDTDIAEKLGLTRSTVRNHVATLYSKVGVHSRSSAIVWARERGINIGWPASGGPSLVRHPPSHRKAAGLGATGKNR